MRCSFLFVLTAYIHSAFVSSFVPWHSNEATQLESYLRLSNDPTNITSTLNVCYEPYPDDIMSYLSCSKNLLKLSNENNLWQKAGTDPDCRYSVNPNLELRHHDKWDIFSFQILQSDCLHKIPMIDTLNEFVNGGSSFEITCKTPWGLAAGYVIDHENNIYDVTCIVSRMSMHLFPHHLEANKEVILNEYVDVICFFL